MYLRPPKSCGRDTVADPEQHVVDEEFVDSHRDSTDDDVGGSITLVFRVRALTYYQHSQDQAACIKKLARRASAAAASQVMVPLCAMHHAASSCKCIVLSYAVKQPQPPHSHPSPVVFIRV